MLNKKMLLLLLDGKKNTSGVACSTKRLVRWVSACWCIISEWYSIFFYFLQAVLKEEYLNIA